MLDCEEIMGVTDDTINNRIKAKYGITFSAYRNKKMSLTRMTLVQKALDQAKAGNVTMMIFCLKNLCGWSDKNELAVGSIKEKIEIKFE
jgi:hypothetical protein